MSAEFHGRNRGGDAAMAGDDDATGLRVERAQAGNDVEPVAIWQPTSTTA